MQRDFQPAFGPEIGARLPGDIGQVARRHQPALPFGRVVAEHRRYPVEQRARILAEARLQLAEPLGGDEQRIALAYLRVHPGVEQAFA